MRRLNSLQSPVNGMLLCYLGGNSDMYAKWSTLATQNVVWSDIYVKCEISGKAWRALSEACVDWTISHTCRYYHQGNIPLPFANNAFKWRFSVTLTLVFVKPLPSALNMKIPAFAAECRRLQHAARSCRSISLAPRALSSKPAGRRCCWQSTGQTDRRTDAQPLHRPYSDYYAGSVKN